jgi:hypothetical protein
MNSDIILLSLCLLVYKKWSKNKPITSFLRGNRSGISVKCNLAHDHHHMKPQGY